MLEGAQVASTITVGAGLARHFASVIHPREGVSFCTVTQDHLIDLGRDLRGQALAGNTPSSGTDPKRATWECHSPR